MSLAWDTFFYYGTADLQTVIEQDIRNGVVTKQKKLFYNRSDSAGANEFENHPGGLAIQVGLKFQIVKWLAYRNTYVGDGTNGSKERRLATSQGKVEVTNNIQKGNVDINIFYIPFFNYNNLESINLPIGVS